MKIKKKILMKFGNIVKITTGSKKDFIGKVIGLKTKKALITILLFFNSGLLKNKSLQKTKNFENLSIYNEKDFLYNQNLLEFKKNNFCTKKKAFLNHIVDIKKNNKTLFLFKKYFNINLSNIAALKANDNLFMDLKKFLTLIKIIK